MWGKVDFKKQADLLELGDAECNQAEFITDNSSYWK